MAISIVCSICARPSAGYDDSELSGVADRWAALREKLTAAKWDCRRLRNGAAVAIDCDYCPSCARFA